MQKRQILRHITESSLIDYIHHFYSGVYIEGLAQGNILAEVRLVFDTRCNLCTTVFNMCVFLLMF